MTFIADVFPEVPVPKNMVRYWSKKPCFGGPLDNKENGSRHCSNLSDSTFTQSLLNAGKVLPLEKVSFSDTQNSKAFGSQIDSRWEGLSA